MYARSFRPSATDLATLVAVAEPAQAGDVLVIHPERTGLTVLARAAEDTGVFGIAADPGVVLGAEPPVNEPDGLAREGGDLTVEPMDPAIEVPVALSGVALCKVDAGYGSVVLGDLLTTSLTPGHAMRTDDPQPGTILGKALEPLEYGTGLIKVLVMLR